MAGTHDYCTIFDHHYLVRALALYRSLERSDPNFILRAVCMDSASRELLGRLSLPSLRIVPIEEIEGSDQELRNVRPARTSWEYCWTATPAVCRHFLEAEPDLELLTYLDADLFLWSSPAPLFDELGDASILLVPNRSVSETTGVYNVGWVTFRNDARGRAAVRWWRERCLEWCHDRVEPDRFGDQKYLDDWPTRFEGVCVSACASAGLAWWNVSRHELSPSANGGPPLVDEAPLIYFHHSGIRVHRATRISRLVARRTGELHLFEDPVNVVYTFSPEPSVAAVRDLIWRPYMVALTAALGEFAEVQAPVGELVDSRPSHRLVLRLLLQLLQRRVPALGATSRRLPLGLQQRIRHWLAS